MNWRTIKLALLALLAILLVVLVVQNTKTVEVGLLFWKVTAPLVLLMIIIGALGFGIGLLVATIAPRRETKARQGRR